MAVDPKFFRPAEVDTLLGDASKAKRILKWEPKITFEEMVAEMAKEDLILARKEHFEALVRDGSFMH